MRTIALIYCCEGHMLCDLFPDKNEVYGFYLMCKDGSPGFLKGIRKVEILTIPERLIIKDYHLN